MTGGDKFSLRLSEFESNVKTFWKDLELDKDFCDVTLACEDKQIKTHNVVISSCIPAFKNILKMNQNHHPLIYLRRVEYNDLQNILTFMYQGEVNVAEEDLPTFLEVAQDLQIRGLSKENKDEGTKEGYNLSQKEQTENHHQSTTPNPTRNRSVDYFTPDSSPGESNFKSLQTGDGVIDNENANNASQAISESQNKVVKKEEIEQNDEILVSLTEANSCSQCDYKPTNKYSLKKHIESVHQKISVSCNKCDKQFSSNDNLRQHNASVHEGVRYSCEHCDYKATQRVNLRTHISRNHTKE